jgi:hypothetical protein
VSAGTEVPAMDADRALPVAGSDYPRLFAS